MKRKPSTVQMIPVESVYVLNPRIRNTKVFNDIVQNIAKVGLKRPITVTPSYSRSEGKKYDLVCGQGRLEAFIACGQKTIPAMIIDADEEQALIMSLVENVARRKQKPMELMHGVEALRSRGFTASEIAIKIGYGTDYIKGVLYLMENGEERLVSAVESGSIPIKLAIDIAMSPEDEQKAMQEAYENKLLSGHKLMAAKRILDTRRRCGKEVKRVRRSKDGPVSAQSLVKALEREAHSKRLMVRKSGVAERHLAFLIEALRVLRREDHFMTLLRAENLETMPKPLAQLMKGRKYHAKRA